MGFSEKREFFFFRTVCFPVLRSAVLYLEKKYKLYVCSDCTLLDKAMMTTHSLQSQPTLWMEMSSHCLPSAWPVLDSVSNIIVTVQSVSAAL